jgi:two-component sensor histidine kinase
MPQNTLEARIAKLLQREKALAAFGTFAFRETALQVILDEAARVCAECLSVPFCKVCRYDPTRNDLQGVVGYAISVADESSPQGRAFTTGEPQICPDIGEANTYNLPSFYPAHGIVSTVDVLVAAKTGPPFGVLEVDSQNSDAFDEHDIDFLTGFANILAEAVATGARAAELRRTVLRMEELIEQKETLSRELKHRVRNNLHVVYAMLTAELDGQHDPNSILAFRSIALRVMGLAQVFDHLLGIGMTRVINFGDYVSALCRNLPELYNEADIRLSCAAEPFQVELDEATALGIIITELVNNAYLHAFLGRSGDISVALRVTANGASLLIADTGTGFVETPGKRHGMGLVRRLVQQVGAKLAYEARSGSRWTITLRDGAAPPLAA